MRVVAAEYVWADGRHLRDVYRELGVDSREELAAAFEVTP